MSELRELYQEVILDHGRHPRNFGELEGASHMHEGHNPLCGDQLVVFVKEQDGVITEVKFAGVGCAISMASASLMTEYLTGKTVEQATEIFNAFHRVLTGNAEEGDEELLDKLKVLEGVMEFPVRVKCATLAWHTLDAALKGNDDAVSTE